MSNTGIEGFEIGLNHFMAEEIRDALQEHADSHGEHAGHAPFDMDQFHVFSPWDDHSYSPEHGGQAHHLTIGTPDGDGFTHQTTAFTCAVVSQMMILDQFHITDPHSGEPLSESRLMFDAAAHGWLSEHGTPVPSMANLMEYYGLPCHHATGWHSLVNDLAAGHQAVMALNADPLWNESILPSPLIHLFGNAPNHALVLRGMRVDDHDRVVVVVNDPGQHDGAGVEYPFEDFQNALAGHDFHYVATDIAPPGWTPNPQCECLTHGPFGSFIDACTAGNDSEDDGSYVDYLEGMDEEQKHSFLKNL